jgi:hypothetical protein
MWCGGLATLGRAMWVRELGIEWSSVCRRTDRLGIEDRSVRFSIRDKGGLGNEPTRVNWDFGDKLRFVVRYRSICRPRSRQRLD